MTPYHDHYHQSQAHADPDDTKAGVIIAMPAFIADRAFIWQRGADVDMVTSTWDDNHPDASAKQWASRLPTPSQGANQGWHRASERVTGNLATSHRANPSSQRTHVAQTAPLSLAAQMLAQESPISEQGPPAAGAPPS